ncbi:MAG: Crp/Fnr family transcriptional regulator [Gammaproteobacteria bacterium HGW-Gammaproteobacteria-8]|nr:MAG: Crp/Fnr family transcriptional regulator [Gammaproteobacteria bacterium HGW-Gammaproteobacteria-8]
MNRIDTNKLKNSFLGEELDAADLEALGGLMQAHQLADGEVLVEEGAEDQRLFLLADGRLEVWSGRGDTPERVHVMKPGEFAGTRAFVDHALRQASLKAHGEATVYSLAPEQFESLLESRPRLVYKIMRALFRITHVNLMRMNSEARELANYVYKRGGRY